MVKKNYKEISIKVFSDGSMLIQCNKVDYPEPNLRGGLNTLKIILRSCGVE